MEVHFSKPKFWWYNELYLGKPNTKLMITSNGRIYLNIFCDSLNDEHFANIIHKKVIEHLGIDDIHHWNESTAVPETFLLELDLDFKTNSCEFITVNEITDYNEMPEISLDNEKKSFIL
jgi:hypothetical protein